MLNIQHHVDQAATGAKNTHPSSVVSFAVLVGSLIFFFLFANLDGYEGDDLNSVVPMLYLDAALAGLFEIYRYDWQPLSYVVGSWLAEETNRSWPIFLLPGIGIALAITLFYRLLARLYDVPAWAFLCIVLMTPEIFYTGLYYNSAALGFPAAVGALSLTLGPMTMARAVLVGGLLGLALTFRLDFVLIAPAMLLLMWFYTRTVFLPLVAAAVLGTIGLGTLATGFIRLENLLSIYEFASNEMAAKANDPGWNTYTKAFVASTILSPIGFAFYGLGIPFLMLRLSRAALLRGLGVALALTPAFLSIPNILSVKYMLPAFVFVPVVGGLIWQHVQSAFSSSAHWINGGLIAGTAFLCVASVDVDNAPPYAEISVLLPRQIPTHDGGRSWGAYLPQMMRVKVTSNFFTESKAAGSALAKALVSGPPRTIAFVGEQSVFSAGGIGWRHALLLLANKGFRPNVEGSGLLSVDAVDNRLWIAADLERLPTEVSDDPRVVILNASQGELAENIARLNGRATSE